MTGNRTMKTMMRRGQSSAKASAKSAVIQSSMKPAARKVTATSKALRKVER